MSKIAGLIQNIEYDASIDASDTKVMLVASGEFVSMRSPPTDGNLLLAALLSPKRAKLIMDQCIGHVPMRIVDAPFTVRYWDYPGDPLGRSATFGRHAFLHLYPRQPTQIIAFDNADDMFHGKGRVVEEFPVTDPNLIMCDLCGQDPGEKVTMINLGSKAICDPCLDSLLKDCEYTQPDGEFCWAEDGY